MKYGFESFESEPEINKYAIGTNCSPTIAVKGFGAVADVLESCSAYADSTSSALNSISNAISSNDCCTFNWASDVGGSLSMINMSDSLSDRLSNLEAKFDKYFKSFNGPVRNLRSQLKTLTGEWKN